MNLFGLIVFLGLFVGGSIYVWRHRHVDEPFWAEEYRLTPGWPEDPDALFVQDALEEIDELTATGWPP